MSSITTWLQSDHPCDPVTAQDHNVVSKIWFKSKPVTHDFCFRVTQVQLCTDSYDQGFAGDVSAGSWTWFELVILPDEESTQPKKSKEGNELVWRSHSNRIANHSVPTRHFGAIFDRRSELLANLEVGDVLAVRVCARFGAWTNYAENGYITARVINEDLFTPHRWTLDSDIVPALAGGVEDASFSFVSTTPCFVKSEGNVLNSQIWFTTAALDQASIDKIKAIQLFTFSRFQVDQKGPVPEGDCFSWFDLVILESPSDTSPRVENGVSLVWKSHSNGSNDISPFGMQGRIYDVEGKGSPDLQTLALAIKGALKPGNAIGVRVNAQYTGWENYAKSGQLIIRLRNEVAEAIPTVIPDVRATEDAFFAVQKAIQALFHDIRYTSVTTTALTNEARADLVLSAPHRKRPLRLLSCDGGGVRGVSSLRILKALMKKVAEIEGKPDIKPCEYFDMIAGTSTGGLIALMLGRLHMTIEECEAKYDQISKHIFKDKAPLNSKAQAFGTGRPLYYAEKLDEGIKEVIQGALGNEGTKTLLLENNPQCKVLVMAVLADKVSNGYPAVHLRNYNTSQDIPSEWPGWTIWEAGRATASAPVYFSRFHKDDLKLDFIDGGLGFNNPSMQLLKELSCAYGSDFTIGGLVSLGTGIPSSMKFANSAWNGAVSDLFDVATSTERTHHDCKGTMPLFPDRDAEKYFRFNMSVEGSEGDWVEGVPGWKPESSDGVDMKKVTYPYIMARMDDWRAIPMIRGLTEKWLARDEVAKSINACAKRLSGK